jgi:hypothetical protein
MDGERGDSIDPFDAQYFSGEAGIGRVGNILENLYITF